ncbi:MAG: terminase gpA endonuclease subunit, partial [Planctomycetota bacterium]
MAAFVDVQQKALCWLACAWAENFTGAVIDYGSWPDQHREYFTLNDVKVTLADAVPGAGLEGQIFGGLEQLVGMLMGRTWLTDDGTPLRIGKLLIDASWGNSTDTVYQFCRQSVHQVSLLPSHGRYISAAAKPFEEWAKKPGDRVGPGWRIPGSRGQRPVRHGLYDSNFWKTFVHLRLGVAMGDPGCLSLWGREPRRHRM